MKHSIGDLHEVEVFVYSCPITRNMLDELGHANYNKLKEVFETVRHRLCKHLGFGRKTLRTRLDIGLFVVEDHYFYHKPLKLGDQIFFIVKIAVNEPTEILIELRAIRHCVADPSKESGASVCDMELTNKINYRLIMVRLKTGKPTRIPKPFVQSIEHFNVLMTELNTG